MTSGAFLPLFARVRRTGRTFVPVAPAWLRAARDSGHRDARVLVTNIGLSTGAGRRPALLRPSPEPRLLPDGLDGSGSHGSSHGGFGGGPNFHVCQLFGSLAPSHAEP